MEFGAKFDLSLDTEGYGRIEKISFDPYNEGATLREAVERFRERTRHYPERILADQIYRTRENRAYCKGHGIRLSGPVWEGLPLRHPPQIRSRNIRTTQIGLKWRGHSA